MDFATERDDWNGGDNRNPESSAPSGPVQEKQTPKSHVNTSTTAASL